MCVRGPQLDCNTLCDCSFTGGCNSTAVCVCKACTDLNKVASADSQFVDISNAATSVRRQLPANHACIACAATRRVT